MNNLKITSMQCGSLELSLQKPVVMGIINLTPDSFYDGGSYTDTQSVVKRAEQILNEGGEIIDIGAISTRPGSLIPSSAEELARLLNHLIAIRKEFPNALISIDTFRKDVAAVAISEGANIINDISGGMLDEEMIPFMAGQDAAYILMHMQGNPTNMQVNPVYTNVTEEVSNFFKVQIEKFGNKGKSNIILDPGFGFGKNVDHNYQLLNELDRFKCFNYPILVGVSRKSMINKVLGTTPKDALNGTTIVNTIALMRGADILRVHDVKQAAEAVRIIGQFNISNDKR